MHSVVVTSLSFQTIGFLCSGSGTAMQEIVHACRDGRLTASPACIVSNRKKAECLAFGEEHDIPSFYVGKKQRGGDDEVDLEISRILESHLVDLVVLSGYLRQIGPRVLAAYPGRILNIHPSLLPDFGGKGMYGRHVHEAVVAAGRKETGITIHIADEEYDTGPIVAQCALPVSSTDTVDDVEAKVRAREPSFFVETLISLQERHSQEAAQKADGDVTTRRCEKERWS